MLKEESNSYHISQGDFFNSRNRDDRKLNTINLQNMCLPLYLLHILSLNWQSKRTTVKLTKTRENTQTYAKSDIDVGRSMSDEKI